MQRTYISKSGHHHRFPSRSHHPAHKVNACRKRVLGFPMVDLHLFREHPNCAHSWQWSFWNRVTFWLHPPAWGVNVCRHVFKRMFLWTEVGTNHAQRKMSASMGAKMGGLLIITLLKWVLFPNYTYYTCTEQHFLSLKQKRAI